MSACYSNYLKPVKRLQLTLTGFSQLPIIRLEFLMGRLKGPKQTIVFLKHKVVIKKGKKVSLIVKTTKIISSSHLIKKFNAEGAKPMKVAYNELK